ncbi:cation-transporting P-type ATPase [Nakamurella sp. A5-74]|uniref:Cation-transporting P-type ATPase n=1 Tax=Nakamurella sp. A5-74 TaxID=3158264 RepID=A0AAU8DVG9_9ACTN
MSDAAPPIAAQPTSAGLSSAAASRLLLSDGPNSLPPPRRRHPVLQLAQQMVHAFAVMLWVAAALSLVAGMPTLAIAIVAVIVINGVFAFVQEYRADRAAERLGGMMPSQALVRRDGVGVLVDATELVVGDVVVLEAGDRVPADLAILGEATLGIDASLLTGESRAVRPGTGESLYAGTFVVLGHGWATVTATGPRTRLAGVDRATRDAAPPPSPLAVQLRRVVRTIGLVAVGVGVAFFGVSVLLGRPLTDGLLLAIGVCVALVPEGLLPTVTLSLARAAQQMARQHALVRRLESVETLGATTFICTDKTGTLTQNAMAVVRVWTPSGWVDIDGSGYAPTAAVLGDPVARAAAATALDSASRCSPDSRAARHEDRWTAVGDPMEVAVHVARDRLGADPAADPETLRHSPFDPALRRASATDVDGTHLVGAPDVILPLCGRGATPEAAAAVELLTGQGLRVLAVARGAADPADRAFPTSPALGVGPELLAVLALQDPPRPDVAEAIARCRVAGIKIAMVTGDHPATARAVAAEVGLLGQAGIVLRASELPADDTALAAILERDGVVVARVEPEDKLRIARVLQEAGHVVAMTGDGVNDGPALRRADIGVAMGASGTDVARQAADIVLLDDHFGTIVSAVELGRATFANVRRFLTYHLTDNVAELAPFVAWALSGGQIPLGLTVLQILALDIGTDLLPALALGGEPADRRTMSGPVRSRSLIDRRLVFRAFGVLGPAEAIASLGAYLAVLALGGWSFGETASPALLALASGSLFAAIVLAQLANAFACRSETRWIGAVGFAGNRLLQISVIVEVALLFVFLAVPPLPSLLGAAMPDLLGWALALLAVPMLWGADAAQKYHRSRRSPAAGAVPPRSPSRDTSHGTPARSSGARR